ncbi:MAG: transporter substrate-binding domain-containing protein, partial [Proteobacteria bacterium]|nr:transporter substrate-binding domain-containing protein [Pseudomonadota bacterium]
MNTLFHFRLKAYLFALAMIVLIGFSTLCECATANDQPVIHVGSEVNFPPYAFVDEQGQAAGFSVDLIKAVANTMGLSIDISTGTWDREWNALVSGQLDLLPIVAKNPSRLTLVDFSLPHTETSDAFFVRQGDPPIPDLASSKSKSIVTMRSDASHHELLERDFQGNLVLVDSIPEGLRLVESGKHDAFLGPLLICSLEIKDKNIRGLEAGTPIPDYKRVFSFGVRKGADNLRETLNQGLLIIKTNGEYDRIYEKWLAIDDPIQKNRIYLLAAVPVALGIVGLAFVVMGIRKRVLLRRNAELTEHNERLERAEKLLRKSELRLLEAQRLAKAGSWGFDLQTGAIWGSDEVFHIYGMEPSSSNLLPIDEIEACIPEK